ncbi:Ni/Fe hydrogenase subunit alpha [Streptomyces sp. ICBB 8177]|nr:Ni/Fe hydrogenase subunit alpha [Streptomyces sp. ICBB 8177]
MRGREVQQARLSVYEPPRFFEAFLRGRGCTEPPDLTSRICGICPVAYQMSACRAVENACEVTVGGQLASLRRLLYCGEWIESHVLHIQLLHAPDFLGTPDGFGGVDPAAVKRGLRLKRAGNAIVEALGGRAIHPVNARLGGFHRTPAGGEMRSLTELLRQALDDAVDTVRWVAGFDFPEAHCPNAFLALAEPDRYAIDAGTPTVMAADTARRTAHLQSFPLEAFPQRVVEQQVPGSTALHSRLDGEHHLTGPLARYAISGDRLSPLARQMAAEAGLGDPARGQICRNPYRSIIVRAVEVLYAVEEALRIIEGYEPPGRPYVPATPRAATGHGATEAPRGLLYHRYTLDGDGTVTAADIVPPTAQNLGAIEEDLRRQVTAALDGREPPQSELTTLCERIIRNHDPCISCSAHFLDLRLDHDR